MRENNEQRIIGWCIECKAPIYEDEEKGVDYIIDENGDFFHCACLSEKGNYFDGFYFEEG
jgi:hypothetical protein